MPSVIEVRNPEGADVSVALGVTSEPRPAPDRLQSLGDFVSRAAGAVGEERAEALADVGSWWRDEMGQLLRLNKDSFSLWARRPGTSGVSILSIYTGGEAMGSVESIVHTHELAPQDEVLARYGAAGFSDSASWPTLELDPTIDDQRLRLLELLRDMAKLASSEG